MLEIVVSGVGEVILGEISEILFYFSIFHEKLNLG